jgi:CheY-like chemotaxis protein
MQSGKRAIWVIEDNEDDLFLLQRAHKECAIANQLLVFEDTDTVLERAREISAIKDYDQLPSMMFIDFRLQEGHGDELVRKIRGVTPFDFIPMVVMSSSASDAEVVQAYRAGANSYVIKPGSYQELLDLMKVSVAYWLRFNHLPFQ